MYYCIEYLKEKRITYCNTNKFNELTEAELAEALKGIYGDSSNIHLFKSRTELHTFVEDWWHRRGYKNYTMT